VGGDAAAVKWLLDPEWGDLIREADARRPETPCTSDLPAESELFLQLLRERHFGVANGIVDLPEFELPAARRWGDLGDLQAFLRESLCDNHVRFYGGPLDPPGEEGPAVERREIDGVLVIRLRRLYGTPEDHRVLAEWSADADADFAYDRIVIDSRHNVGGNDGFVYDWMARRLRAVKGFASDTEWVVGGEPLGLWNRSVWRNALYGEELRARPEGGLELVSETYDLPGGDRPWHGRMLVLVDRASRSSGESSAWLLREGLGARLVGEPTYGMIEYGNVVPYLLPSSGLAVVLATKRNDYGFPVEQVGFPVDVPLDPETPIEDVVRRFDTFV
jgi:hypothetical protein